MNKIKHTKEHRKFGLKVAFFRKQRGLTQQRLADAMSIDQQQISRIERGAIGVSLDRIIDLAAALGIKASLLFDFEGMIDDYVD